jgi:hypothetical protein
MEQEPDLVIRSIPAGAEVKVSLGDDKFLDLGTTPLKLSLRSRDLSQAKKDELLSLTVIRSGFVPQRILLDTSARKQVEIEVKLLNCPF